MDLAGIIHRQLLRRFIVILAIFLLMLLPSGCGNDSSNGTGTGSSDTGPAADNNTASVSLTINWYDTPSKESPALFRTAALDCQASGVENVVVKVYDAAENLLVTGGPWPCTASGGTIDRILAGQDRRFVVLAEDADGNVRYQGETAGVTITAGEVTQGVVVDARLFITTLTAPENDTEVNPNDVSLEWGVVDSADEYLIQVAEDADFQTIAIDKTTPALVEAPNSLQPAKTYFWKISAVDAYGNIGAGSEVRRFSTSLMPAISGSVRTASGSGIGGVTITFSDGGGVTTTDPSGAYTRAVPIGWSGTVTPSASGYNFSPASRSYTNITTSQSGQDYTGTAVTPTVSGLVRTATGDGISGVTVTFSNNGGSAATNNAGAYSRAVPFGWSGTATPSRTGYTFSPASRNYNNVTANQPNQNFTGTAITPTISGFIRTSTGAAISGVTVTLSNSGGSVTTNAAGAYSLTVPFGWSGTATPSRGGYSFSPPSRPYNNVTANQSNQNFTGTPIPPIISGFVRTVNDTGISGVTVTFSNNGGSVTTDSSGAYNRAVPFGWTGSVTPSRSGYTFTPPSRPYNNVTVNQPNENFTGRVIVPVISGVVRAVTGAGISGVTVTFSNNGGSATTNTSGAYSTTVPFGWTGQATPSRNGFSFSPLSRDYDNVTANQPNQDYTGTAVTVVTVTAVDNSAFEAPEFPGTGTYRISRTGSTENRLDVFFTMSGTADNGKDYSGISGPVTLGVDQSFIDITLTPLNDQNDEPVETAQMTIDTNSAYTRGTPFSATVNITDDDESLLINCPLAGTGGDQHTRGFYVPNYAGINLSNVTMYFSARTAGTYTIRLTAREGAYNGRLVGTSTSSVVLTDNNDDLRAAFFSFAQKPTVAQGSTLTFAISIVQGPDDSLFYGTNTTSSCPVVQTNDTQPPLSSFRRDGIVVIIRGDRF